jgi:hypothetical protein
MNAAARQSGNCGAVSVNAVKVVKIRDLQEQMVSFHIRLLQVSTIKERAVLPYRSF